MRTLKHSECAVLHLVLKRKWFDMIASGEKREEYREATPYWAIRLRNWDNACCRAEHVVEFRLGYAHDAPRMAFVSKIYVSDYGANRPIWGEPNGPHYTIKLSERVILED